VLTNNAKGILSTYGLGGLVVLSPCGDGFSGFPGLSGFDITYSF